jgi:galactokinase
MLPGATKLFRQRFGHPPAHLIHAPAWLALLGGDTRNQQGLALTAALKPGVELAVSPRTDGRIELVVDTLERRDSFWATDFKLSPALPWADTIKHTLARLLQRQVHFKGFSAAVAARLPQPLAHCLPASLTIATALALRQLFPFCLTETSLGPAPRADASGRLPPLTFPEKLALAKFCQSVTGNSADLLGPITGLCAKAWHALSLDLHSLAVETIPLTGAGLVFSQLTGSEPAPASIDFEALARSATEKLGLNSLRSADPKLLQSSRARLAPLEYGVALHLVSEIQRVVAAERALRDDDQRQFGQYWFQSHDSRRSIPGASNPNLETLLSRARLHPACLGARAEQGCALSLAPFHQIDSLAKMLEASPEFKVTSTLCRPEDGAGLAKLD